MLIEITELHPRDAFYADKQKIIGSVFRTKATHEWSTGETVGFHALDGTFVSGCPGFAPFGQGTSFHAVKFLILPETL